MAFSGVSGSMEEGFFTKSQSWKNVRQNRNQDAAHAQKRVTVPLTFLPLNVIKMFTKTRTFAEIPWRLDFSGVDCIFPYTQNEHGHTSR